MATENKLHCKANHKPNPHLEFWYSDDDKKATFTINTFGQPNVLGSTVIQTACGILTDARSYTSTTIGNFTEMKTCVVSTNTAAFVSDVGMFFLNKGNLQYQASGVQSYTNQDYYGLSPNKIYTFKILTGTDDYLNATGYIIVRTFTNLDRLVKIYFTKNKRLV
jgi:hypothetical protein